VARDLGGAVDYLLDGGACEVGVESTIVDLSRGRPVLLRPGGLPREAIEAVIGAITGPLAAPDAEAPAAPGTLASHYAPAAEVIAVAADEVPAAVAAAVATHGRGARVAVLAPAAAFAAWPDLPAQPYRLPDDLAGIARSL